jgi:ribosome-binding factor A
MPRVHRGFDRMQRVADLIQRSLAQIFLKDVSDDRFRFISITGVTVTRDLAYANIYVSLFAEEEVKIRQSIDALNRATKYIRYKLANDTDLRVVPELRFFYDESLLRGSKISSLIHRVMKKS